MQFMQQIVQGNPKYQEALQGDERFQALLENYDGDEDFRALFRLF